MGNNSSLDPIAHPSILRNFRMSTNMTKEKLSQINKVIIATPKKRNKSGPKTSPLNELTPGSKQITRRMKRIIELVLEESVEQKCSAVELLGMIIHKLNYRNNREIASVGMKLFDGKFGNIMWVDYFPEVFSIGKMS